MSSVILKNCQEDSNTASQLACVSACRHFSSVCIGLVVLVWVCILAIYMPMAFVEYDQRQGPSCSRSPHPTSSCSATQCSDTENMQWTQSVSPDSPLWRL